MPTGSFAQTKTAWQHDGNDESTIVETTNGTLVLFTRPNHAVCPGLLSTSRCVQRAISTSGGLTWSRPVASLQATRDKISALSLPHVPQLFFSSHLC